MGFAASTRPEPPLLFGVATADHQCEAYEARWEDVWDRWERDQRLVARGRATDFWTRYTEDVELARRLGCTAFRFSVAWARVEPSPGWFDASVLEHYGALAAAIVEAGMEPVVTLLHNTWPLHVQDQVVPLGDEGGRRQAPILQRLEVEQTLLLESHSENLLRSAIG